MTPHHTLTRAARIESVDHHRHDYWTAIAVFPTGYDLATGDSEILLHTCDPFAADTLRHAQDTGCHVWIEFRRSGGDWVLIGVECQTTQEGDSHGTPHTIG